MSFRRSAILIALALTAVLAGCTPWSTGTPTPTPFVITPSAELLAQGRQLYGLYCGICHGDEQGKGLVPPAPPHTGQGHTWHHADRQLVEWVLDGPPIRGAMPAFRGQLSEAEVVAIIAYIKTFWSEEQRKTQAAMSLAYDEQVRSLTPTP